MATSATVVGMQASQPTAHSESSQRACVAVESARDLARRRRRTRLSGRTGTLDPGVVDVVSFEGHKDLLRASRLSLVMSLGAAIFTTGEGSAETYTLSQQVTAIDAFLSHNWAVSRVKKFLCLTLHFNIRIAVLAAVSTLAVVAFADSQGARMFVLYHPVNNHPVNTGEPGLAFLQHGCGCSFLTTPVFLLVVFFGHELQRLVGFCESVVFLDKTCIHQVDEALQKQGILKLGAFLRNSSRMVVLYTDLYLTKLWTVYEVACFLSMHPPSHLIVVPTFQPVLVFGGIVIMWCRRLLFVFLTEESFLTLFTIDIFTYLPATCVSVVVFRRWAREKEAIHQRVANFQLDGCTCFCEDDRPVVYHSIAQLMRAIREVRRDASEQDALESFNGLVRECVSISITCSIGPIGLTYRHIVAILLCTFVPTYFDIYLMGKFLEDTVLLPEDVVVRFRVVWAAMFATWTFGIFPLFIALISKVCRLWLHLQGWQEWTFLTCTAVVSLLILFGLKTATEGRLVSVAVNGPHRDVGAAAVAVLLVVTTLLAVAVFTWTRRLHEDLDEQEAEPRGVRSAWRIKISQGPQTSP